MLADWKDGDDMDPKAARELAKKVMEDPKHARAKGSPDDLSTVDDPIETPDEGGEE